MNTKTVVVGSAAGLHARPAAAIAQAGTAYDEEILLLVEGEEPIDATSALMIMTLGADCGTSVTVESENAEAVTEIASLIAQNLDA